MHFVCDSLLEEKLFTYTARRDGNKNREGARKIEPQSHTFQINGDLMQKMFYL